MKFDLSIPVIAMRREANHRSELINQVLFGETIEMIEQNEEWSYVKIVHDDYKGWIENKGFFFKESQETSSEKIITSFSARIIYEQREMRIPFGSFFRDSSCELLEGSCLMNCDVEMALELIRSQFLGAPYLWGGRTGFGIDCSGLTQLFYRLLDISIPRDTYLQVGFGDDIFLSQVKIGDLLFYRNNDNKIVHVGIAIDKQYILHASGDTRIDEYDANGIFNHTLNKYTHLFAFAKRIIRHG